MQDHSPPRCILAGLAWFILAVLPVGAADTPPAQKPPDPQAVAFFEQKIRPVLTEHCLRCHSVEAEQARKLKAGLYLDTADGMRKGGESGPVLVPHKAADSLLLKALRHDSDVRMPPNGKLPTSVIADFEKWLNMGAPDPRQGPVGKPKQIGMTVEEGRTFWAYQVPQPPVIPAVKTADWPLDDLDRFVLARLEARGLKPAAEADRATLARRLTYDLIGLPPTPEEVDAFTRDPDPLAYEKLVDRLLASQQFGERWGRHWLDIARYAESVTLRGFIFKEAWRYRDYVIDSFNRDVPFDQFVREQIAGDLLPAATPASRRRQLVATTFLALGNTNLEEQDKKQLRMDVVDEQLDVITKGLLAQTVTCARCHDHKFDPIPTRDYYALAGILRNARAMEHANVSKWIEVPLPADPDEEVVLRQHEQAITALQDRIKAEKARSGTGATTASGVLAVQDVPGIVVDDTAAKKVGEWQVSRHNGTYIGTGYIHDQDKGKGEKTLTFQPEMIPPGMYEVRLAYTPGTNRAAAVPVTVFSADGERTVSMNMKQTPPLEGRFFSLGEYRFEKNGLCYVLVSNEGTKGHVIADAVVFLPLDKADPGVRPVDRAPPMNGRDTIRALEAELKRLQSTGPKRHMVMTVVEEQQIEDAHIHVRGSVHNLGETVPRGFLQVATAGTAPTIPKDLSGRRELAEWIVSRENPLTARVFVNRVWHWLFGSGIVRTTDNFGTTGERPSHPELLDHLAVTFVADGWSMKQMIRRIVLSRTYRQSSTADASSNPQSTSRNPQSADPENRLFGRANRRRLEAECIRDTILHVSGQLNPSRGGPTFPASLAADYGYQPTANCRSVYLPQFRNAMPEILELFDAADPSMVTGRRNVGTVAAQALYLMNHPFVMEQARHAAAKLLGEKLADDAARVTRAYRQTLGREPTAGERQVVARWLQARDANEAWTMLFHALFASAEFRYVN
jgi:hypothetical protein